MVLSIEKIKLETARKQKSIAEVLKLAHISSVTARRINAGHVDVADLLLNKI